eukprot:CAMPEP_0167748798 /NCGR_PEP_ID=MMETSP0110_2-20121227/5041_1 /TAXON_ID=629695 /ORGANISM="Gymnochlora sp., Strain CCMP2014" /LENGTH=1062 /DNA_ID=CAMNT_0007633859 /DNA_START=70 /DNA_END=3258 /DNA_ORIENTATION=+
MLSKAVGNRFRDGITYPFRKAGGILPRWIRGSRAHLTARAQAVPNGFSLLKTEEIDEYSAKATIFEHKKTGAQILSMEKDDDNKVFGVAFRTPVEDSMGIPHILEHSVLCGSRKYTTKSPFIQLQKSSLKTFLNAMTYPDRTLYPVASMNDKDFYNLVDVYLDSVLHPRAIGDPNVMAQEGWHYELNDAESPLSIKGVVYNEMKGVYSSPDSLHNYLTFQALFPDVETYKERSGGDPEKIPSLTYEKFREFHGKYYHPSNARFFFYGNDPVEKRLEILEQYLNDFEPLPEVRGRSEVPTQSLKSSPYSVHQTVPVAKGQEANKNTATVAWLVSEERLPENEQLAWQVIDQLLIGNTAAKLRKALSDSGLGSAVIGGGMSTGLKQPYYSIGLKGMASKEDSQKVLDLVLEILTDAAENGFEESALDAALNRVEFGLREFDTGSSQRGLSFMFSAMSDWNYDQDPIQGFKFEEDLAQLKDNMAKDPNYLKSLIKTRLLDNNHRVLVTSSPDSSLEEKKLNELKEKLQNVKSGMSDEEIQEVMDQTKKLTALQAAPDKPEDIAKIPRLTLKDLDKEAKEIPFEEITLEGGVRGLTHSLATNGIVYADLVMDISGIDTSLLDVLNLFTRIASGATGTTDKSRVDLRHYIDTHTGGVSCSWTTFSPINRKDGEVVVQEPDKVSIKLEMTGKAVAEKSDELFQLFSEMLYDCKLDDQERVIQMLKESKSGMESGLVGGGNRYAGTRLASMRHIQGLISEKSGGLSYYASICRLLKEAETDFPSLQKKLQKVKDAIRSADPTSYLINLTADEKTLEKSLSSAQKFTATLPGTPAEGAGDPRDIRSGESLEKFKESLGKDVKDEGVIIPTQVNYIGLGGRLYQPGERVPGSASVISNFLRTAYLWDKVRVIGGAYGAGFSLNNRFGTFAFTSYRDPNVKETVENYKKAAEFLINEDIPDSEVERAIIGTISGMDYPQTPRVKGGASLSRYLTGYNHEDAQRYRDEVLGTSIEDFRDFGRRLQKALDEKSATDKPAIVAFGSKSSLSNSLEEGLSLDLIDAFAQKEEVKMT